MFPYINHDGACDILSSSKLSVIPMPDRRMCREETRPTLPPVRDLFRGMSQSLPAGGRSRSDAPHVDELSRSPRPPMNLTPPWIVSGPRVDQNFERSFSRVERRQDSQLDGPGVQVHLFTYSVVTTNVLDSILHLRRPIIRIPHSNAVMDVLYLIPPLPIVYHHL